MKVLLVEDEPSFRKGLAKMIADTREDWDVCGEAENGEEALRLAERLRPELVITDIRMPLMDGLELLKRTKERLPETEVIVITGYQDFQYAQAALRYGAMDLLVKPCAKPDIDEALDKAERAWLEKQGRLRQAAEERQLLLDHTLRSMLLRAPYAGEAAAELSALLSGSRLLLLEIADFCPSHKQYAKRDMPLLQFAVLNIVEDWMDMAGVSGRLLLVEGGRFLVFSSGAEAGALSAFARDVGESIERVLGLRVERTEGGVVESLAKLADDYEAALARRKGSGGAPAGEVREIGAGTTPINLAKQRNMQAQLTACILSGQTELLAKSVDQAIQELRGLTPDEWKLEALAFSMALRDTARKHLEREDDPQALAQRIAALNGGVGPGEAESWIRAEADRFLAAFGEWQRKHGAGSISRAIQYIEKHYAESLSLRQVAAQVHLNPSYFSHLFKKITGASFVNYLIEVRMDKAKQLLSNTDLNVTEVAGKVGYDLPNYFAKLFKQSAGVTPKEFRRQRG